MGVYVRTTGSPPSWGALQTAEAACVAIESYHDLVDALEVTRAELEQARQEIADCHQTDMAARNGIERLAELLAGALELAEALSEELPETLQLRSKITTAMDDLDGLDHQLS